MERGALTPARALPDTPTRTDAVRSLLLDVRTGAADFLFPRTCAACERALDRTEAGIVCGRCWARLRWLPAPQCARCGHPLGEKLRARAAAASSSPVLCHWCPLLPPYVRSVRSVCWVSGGSALAIVHALKYRGWHAVADGMAERMARLDWPRDAREERAAVLPVPLGADRLRERGYNQSERLARALAARWGAPLWTDCLTRTRGTRTQTRLTPQERLRNVSGAFRADTATRELRGKHVVLVDDVVTTAATLNACAAALFEAGARVVSYATFGRAPATGDRR